MPTSPPDSLYVTGEVPPEMREGLGPSDVAPPTGAPMRVSTDETIDVDGTPTQLTHIRLPRPDNIPNGPPKFVPPPPAASPLPPFGVAGLLSYDFPLLPGVQCRVMFQGEVTADHLEQLLDYLGVACKRLRQQRERFDLADAKIKEMATNAVEMDKALEARRDGRKTLKRTGGENGGDPGASSKVS